jgi:hypothetical protein
MVHEVREECLTWRADVERRLEEAKSVGKTVSGHDVEIGVLKTNMEILTGSLHALTRAIWGFVIMVMGTLIGFFVWYVQTSPGSG